MITHGERSYQPVNQSQIDATKIIPVRSIIFGLLVLELPKPDDMIFLNAAADRPQDREDIVRLVKSFSVDWNILLDNLKEHHKENRKAVFFAVGCLIGINKKENIIPQDFLEKAAKLFGLQAE